MTQLNSWLWRSAVEDGEDTEMFKMMFNIIVQETEISNFMSYI